MCILCVVQKWSRRVATMLPWLLFPLLGLWAFSHLLPPGFRFEFTSPRIACVLVLLVTIFWYEVLMPQLSAWRARNSAKCKEAKRREALEMQKLRKIATRLCRNCLTAYKDQNPGGGKFMCAYCGHVSKRPVLDIPGTGNDSKDCCIFDRNVTRRKSSNESSNLDDMCFTTRYCKAGNRVFMRCRRFWRNVFGLASDDDTSSDGDNEDMFREGENGLGYQESKGEKARRKAEERRQARLERELLEEEEKKQREEVAKLVEEQRRLRDEKLETERMYTKSSLAEDRDKNNKKEVERKRQERRKEKDKGSSKSNSDCEDIEKKVGKDSDKKREVDKKNDSVRRDLQKVTTTSTGKVRSSEAATKIGTALNSNRGNGTRYLDRMKGSFMSSSKAFNGSSFFGKSSTHPVNVISKAGNHVGSGEHIQTAFSRKEHVSAKLNMNGDAKISKTNSHQPVAPEAQQQATPKKSWRQLFTRSPAVYPSTTEAFSSALNQTFQGASQSSFLPGQASPTHPLADQMSFGLPLPFSLSPFTTGSNGSSPMSSSVAEPIYPNLSEKPYDLVSEEPDIFEDPCYIPDPVSLLGPVSESLDNFSLDLGGGLKKDAKFERSYPLNNHFPSAEVSKPSPIEAPMSRLKFVEERHSGSYPSTPKSQNMNSSPFGSTNEDEDGTWKMWSTPPLGQDGFGLIGGSGNWLLPLGQNASSQDEKFHPSAKPLALQFPDDDQLHLGAISPRRLPVENCQNGGMFYPLTPGSNENNPWMQRHAFQPSSGDRQENFPSLIPWENIPQTNVTLGGSNDSSCYQPSELSPANRWPKKDCAVNGAAGEGNGISSAARPHIGGLFTTPDVQSLWSYN